jgi:hypothetical protein
VGLGNRTNEDVTTTVALRKRVDYDRYVGSLKIKVGDQEYSCTILNISADSYNEIDGYPELKVRFFVGTTLYEALNEGSTAWQISKVTDVAEWEQKLAQLDQEWQEIKDAHFNIEVQPHIEKVVVAESTAIIDPDKFYVFENPVAALAIGFNPQTNSEYASQYMFQFTCPADAATTLSVPTDVLWSVAPEIKAGKTYQVSVVNNLAIITSWGD